MNVLAPQINRYANILGRAINSLYPQPQGKEQIWNILGGMYPERQPYQGENEYFQSNPNVAGMAADDNQIVINPYSSLSPHELDAVRNNERIRLYLNSLNMTPYFQLTNEQMNQFRGTPYDNNPQAKNTLIARYLTDDPSALNVTPQQKEFADNIVNMIGAR